MLTEIEKPTLLLDEAKARRNIQRMMEKAMAAGVQLRPHFKTHQSAEIGAWFREAGVSAITVSSLDMAAYFVAAGWGDVLVAFPLNMRQMALINQLARQTSLGLLVLDEDTAVFLNDHLQSNVNVWLEIDAGYGRSGLVWTNQETINRLARLVHSLPRLQLQGILTHAGNTYAQSSLEAVIAVHQQTVERLNVVRDGLRAVGLETAVSIGDTPGCSIATNFSGVDEIRPGNYVFYDLMQLALGSCAPEDIAIAVACPVVARYEDSQRVILYGGGVHLSKDMMVVDGQNCYGRIAFLNNTGWGEIAAGTLLTGLSQEHGIVQTTPEVFAKIAVGDVLYVLPVHSCMTVDLYGHYTTLNGQKIPKMRTNI